MPRDASSFGELMSQRRNELRLKQHDLAVATDYSDSYISQIEEGKRRHPISLHAAERIATALRLEGVERERFLAARTMPRRIDTSARPSASGVAALVQTIFEQAVQQLRALFAVSVGRRRTARSVMLVAAACLILLAVCASGLAALLSARASSGRLEGALLRPTTPPCVGQTGQASAGATPAAEASTGTAANAASATWQLIYPSTTQCAQSAEGMRLTFHRDVRQPQISDIEYDLRAVGGLPYAQANVAIALTERFVAPHSASTWAGLIVLTPVSLPAGGLYQYGGYFFLLNPGLDAWELVPVDTNGFAGMLADNSGPLPHTVNPAQPLALMVKLLGGAITLFVNGQQLHAPYPIDANSLPAGAGGPERVAGVFLSCPNAATSEAVDISQFAIYHLHP